MATISLIEGEGSSFFSRTQERHKFFFYYYRGMNLSYSILPEVELTMSLRLLNATAGPDFFVSGMRVPHASRSVNWP
jgi:hypothetical protein